MNQEPQLEIKGLSLPPSDLLVQTPLSEAVKEMFNDFKIDMITDLSDDEIKLITRIYMIADMKDINVWRNGVKYYLRLLLSRKRKSRRELLDAIVGTQKKLGLLAGIANAFKGGQNDG